MLVIFRDGRFCPSPDIILMGVIMENEEPLKKKRRKKKKRKKDMGNLFFNITQLAILCIFLGVCFIIFQTGYIQKVFQLHQEAQQIM